MARIRPKYSCRGLAVVLDMFGHPTKQFVGYVDRFGALEKLQLFFDFPKEVSAGYERCWTAIATILARFKLDWFLTKCEATDITLKFAFARWCNPSIRANFHL